MSDEKANSGVVTRYASPTNMETEKDLFEEKS